MMKSKTLPYLGSRELLSFSDSVAASVPAKVDTGADYSSVWASNIQEENGTLSFELFAPGSPHYTGEKLSTRDYVLTRVRNSFGHSQERYRVKLGVAIAGKKIRVNFTLADRSNNRYPVLIGRKTIHNKFLVDVSLNRLLPEDQDAKVLVLNSIDSPGIRKFVDRLNAQNEKVACEFSSYDDIMITIVDKQLSCVNLATNKAVTDYDLIYFKTYFKAAEMAAAIAEIAQANDVPFIDKEVLSYYAQTKLTQYVKLARADIAVPDSVIIPNKHLKQHYQTLVTTLGNRFVMKDVAGEKGESNYLVQSEAEFLDVCNEALAQDALYVAQQYIENDGDYRVLIFNQDIELIIQRKKTDEATHLNNTSKGGSAMLVDKAAIGSEPLAMAVKAATTTNRQVAGVDLIHDNVHGGWYILEVNNSPQIASGAYINEKAALFARFLRRYAEK
jgi:glutathione synthase/RimK-type ligase-like ATP-grasp enzyme